MTNVIAALDEKVASMERLALRVAVGADHRGRRLCPKIVKFIDWLQCEAIDLGSSNGQQTDYPNIAAAVARIVSQGEVDRGILIGATGLEMALVANKFPGVRAASCSDEVLAETTRRHLDLNVLCISAELVSEPVVEQMIVVWLSAPFDGGRHSRRLRQIAAIEDEILAAATRPSETFAFRTEGVNLPARRV